MQVLLHYTTARNVFAYFNQNHCQTEIKNESHLIEIITFHEKYERYQENLFFIICFSEKFDLVKYTVGKVKLNKDEKYIFEKVDTELEDEVINGLGITNINTYNKGVFYKENTLNDTDEFSSRRIADFSNKIKLRYFCWTELLDKNNTLFEKICNILFDEANVLNIASLYSNKHSYDDRILKKSIIAHYNL